MWVWFLKTLCFVRVSFSSSLFIPAAFFFALLLGTGYAIFRKYALQMNHQVVVVKLPATVDAPSEGEHKGLLRSTQRMGWVTFGVGCPGSGGASPTVPASGEHRTEKQKRAGEHRSLTCSQTPGQQELQQHQNTRRERALPSGRSPVKLPPGSSGALQRREKQGHN